MTVSEQFGYLSPHEPRLVKKLQPPITELISTTAAISLLYECVHTCIVGGMLQSASGDKLAELCVTKLAAFLQDPDQNRRFTLETIHINYSHINASSQIYRFACLRQNCAIALLPSGPVPGYDIIQRKRPRYQYSSTCSRSSLRHGMQAFLLRAMCRI